MKEEDKNVKIGITIHPKLYELLDKESKDKKISRSKMIQNIMNEHFKKIKTLNDL